MNLDSRFTIMLYNLAEDAAMLLDTVSCSNNAGDGAKHLLDYAQKAMTGRRYPGVLLESSLHAAIGVPAQAERLYRAASDWVARMCR